MDQQLELLAKLLAFYKSRYSGKELETKFNDACEDLLSTGDIKKAVYMKFCVDNDVEPRVKKVVTPSPSSSSSYGYDGCSGGGGYRRSSC
jgi:hypothetical protein